jgi:hypothetical protein
MKRILATAAGLLVVATALLGCATDDRTASRGWETLIDGGSGLNNFQIVGDANWRAQDGAIQADKRGAETSYLVSRQSYADFIIYVEFWVNEEANSGVWMRLSDRQKIGTNNAYEVQINDKRSDGYGTGSIANVAKVSPALKAGGQWNSLEITAKGAQLTVKMNGKQTVDIADRSFFHGPFALQYGGGIVKYRKVLIKPI